MKRSRERLVLFSFNTCVHTVCMSRETFMQSFLLFEVVWPYGTGEVIVQNYNALLTLSHLYQSSDAILVMENDSLHKICSQLLNIRKISFQDINRVITHKLASFLQPAHSRAGGSSITNELGAPSLLLDSCHGRHGTCLWTVYGSFNMGQIGR